MMSPQEEYLIRHGLSDVAVIRHVESGTVFVTSESPLRSWTVLSIKWKDNPIHPGEYHLCYLAPIHNGHKSGQVFEKMDEFILQYDEYEHFIYQWASKLADHRAIEGDWQSVLACWEMFLYIFDDWFVENTSSSLKRLIYESINLDQDVSQRLNGYQDAISLLTEQYPYVLKRFKFDVLPHIHSYCDWLARLVNYRFRQSLPLKF